MEQSKIIDTLETYQAPDNLLEALRGASIVDAHRALMGTVIVKVQFVKSGLTESCTSLLSGFEVK